MLELNNFFQSASTNVETSAKSDAHLNLGLGGSIVKEIRANELVGQLQSKVSSSNEKSLQLKDQTDISMKNNLISRTELDQGIIVNHHRVNSDSATESKSLDAHIDTSQNNPMNLKIKEQGGIQKNFKIGAEGSSGVLINVEKRLNTSSA